MTHASLFQNMEMMGAVDLREERQTMIGHLSGRWDLLKGLRRGVSSGYGLGVVRVVLG